MAFIMLRYLLSFSAYLTERFNYKWMLYLVKCLFYIYWINHMTFILYFVQVVYQIDQFAYGELSFYPWDEPHLIVMHYFLMCFYLCFASILFRIFTSVFIRDTGLWCCVCVCVCVIFARFWYQGYGGLIKCVRQY